MSETALQRRVITLVAQIELSPDPDTEELRRWVRESRGRRFAWHIPEVRYDVDGQVVLDDALEFDLVEVTGGEHRWVRSLCWSDLGVEASDVRALIETGQDRSPVEGLDDDDLRAMVGPAEDDSPSG